MPEQNTVAVTFTDASGAFRSFSGQMAILQDRLTSFSSFWPTPRVSAMLSAEDAILLRGLRSDFWLDIDGAEVVVPFEERRLKFSCDYDVPIKVNMGVVGFPWKELREGVRLDFSVVVRKKVHFESVEPADDKPTEQHAGHLYVHVRQPDGNRRSYLIQAADFNPYIKN